MAGTMAFSKWPILYRIVAIPLFGRPLFNYWSFKTPDDQMYKTTMSDNIAWMTHVALHFFSDTRWSRTLKQVK